MTDISDAVGLAETGISLGTSLLFTGMMLNFTKDMTDKLITQGKQQKGRRPQKRKSYSNKYKKQQSNPFSAKNLNKSIRY